MCGRVDNYFFFVKDHIMTGYDMHCHYSMLVDINQRLINISRTKCSKLNPFDQVTYQSIDQSLSILFILDQVFFIIVHSTSPSQKGTPFMVNSYLLLAVVHRQNRMDMTRTTSKHSGQTLWRLYHMRITTETYCPPQAPCENVQHYLSYMNTIW